MVTANSEKTKYLTTISDGVHTMHSDVGVEFGGGRGFQPFDLLCAAYAACLNITARMVFERAELPYRDIHAAVTYEQSASGAITFRSRVEIDSDVDEATRERMLALIAKCPIHKALSQASSFAEIQ